MNIIEFDEQCKPCQATGLYVGLAELDGTAVVCNRCHGTGKHHVRIEYETFIGKQPRLDVCWVVEINPGFVIGVGENHEFQLSSDFGGMSYDDWSSGRKFVDGMEMRYFSCPAWWYNGTDRQPKWVECHGCFGRTFSKCTYFPIKERCWKRFDEENSSKKEKINENQ